ncbi:MAG: alpha/beta fold hydrolase, partial [Pseudobdellovibrionaceae bacterium]|nr:alpha/beta fold hydrolase [Pseudobdellovibrionaceae bacterium]
QAGYHAIAPMMRGYEPSSQPEKPDYSLIGLAHDVLAFIEQTGHPRVHLVGHDWGAVVSYLVASMAPEKLLSLTTIAIPSPGRLVRDAWRVQPNQILNSWYIIFFQLPGVAELALEYRDWAFMEWLWRRWSPDFRLPPDEMRALKFTFQQTGVKKAALGYYRALFSFRSWQDTLATVKHLNGKTQVPTLAFTGAHDRCMDTRLHDKLMHSNDFPAGLKVTRIEKAGHFLHQECPELVNSGLLEHLARHS